MGHTRGTWREIRTDYSHVRLGQATMKVVRSGVGSTAGADLGADLRDMLLDGATARRRDPVIFPGHRPGSGGSSPRAFQRALHHHQ